MWQTKPGPAAVEITDQLIEGQVWFDATRKSSLKRNGRRLTATFFESGVVLIATANPRGSEYYINFRMRVPPSFSGRTRGFMGNFDGNSRNDFYRRGSTIPLPNFISERALLEDFKTCKDSHGKPGPYKLFNPFTSTSAFKCLFHHTLDVKFDCSSQSLQTC